MGTTSQYILYRALNRIIEWQEKLLLEVPNSKNKGQPNRTQYNVV